MPITVELGNGQRITIEKNSATVGRGPGADILVKSTELQPIHAKISKVAGKWMVESEGDWLLQVGDGVPGRKQWLEPNQVVRLTETGVRIIFEPTARTKPVSQVRSAPISETKKVAPSPDSSISSRPPSLPFPPAPSSLQADFDQTGELFEAPRPLTQIGTANAPVSGKEPAMTHQWYYSKNNQQQGPVSAEQLKQLAASRRLQPTDLVWKEGMSQWTIASSINGLFVSLAAPRPSTSPPPSQNRSSTSTAAKWNPPFKLPPGIYSWPTIAALVLFFFPLGFYLVWTHPAWTRRAKVIWSAAWLVLALVVSTSNHEQASTHDTSQPLQSSAAHPFAQATPIVPDQPRGHHTEDAKSDLKIVGTVQDMGNALWESLPFAHVDQGEDTGDVQLTDDFCPSGKAKYRQIEYHSTLVPEGSPNFWRNVDRRYRD